MKTRFLSVIILIAALVVGCKNDKTTTSTEDQTPKVDETFRVTIDAVVKKDDNFQLYYTEGASSDFNEKESLWVSVKGSEAAQKIVFNLPKDYLPSLFRLDFGMSEDQEDIKLNSISIDYSGKNFTATGPEMKNYFRPIDLTKIDFETGIMPAIRSADGKRTEPVLYPHEKPMGEVIKNLEQQ